eukprot:PRCOL_00001478-RA
MTPERGSCRRRGRRPRVACDALGGGGPAAGAPPQGAERRGWGQGWSGMAGDGGELDVPLLLDRADDGGGRGGGGGGTRAHTRLEEARACVQLAAPQSASNLCSFLLPLATVVIVGRLSGADPLPLSAASLAVSLSNVFGNAILIGTASALDTFAGQAWGAGNHAALGVYLQRAMAVSLVLSLFIAVAWALGLSPLLHAIEPDAALASATLRDLASLFLLVLFVGLTECLKRHLQAQEVVKPQLWVSAAAAALHVPIALGCVWVLGGRAVGALWGAGVSNALLFAMFAAYVWRRGDPRVWPGWTWRAWKGWGEYMRVAAPGAAMIMLEWIAFEVAVIVAGSLPGDPEVTTAASAILFNCVAVLFMIPYGLSGATSTRVGNALGRGDAKAARRTAVVATVLALGVACLQQAIMLGLRGPLPKFFSKNADVERAVHTAFPFLCLEVFFDNMQCVISGVVRGQGSQNKGAAINLVAYYCIGLPLGLSLAFKTPMGLTGLWAGLSTGAGCQTLGQATLVFTGDWDRLTRAAVERAALEDAHRGSDEHAGGEDETGGGV